MMNRSTLLFLLLALAGSLVFAAACGGPSAEGTNAGETREQPDDHQADSGMTHIHAVAPDEFASLENPLADDLEAIEAGEALFQTNCVVCHGPEGQGDGPGAAALDPKPAALGDQAMMGSLSDGYLFWRISKGGAMEPFNSAMPAWEAGLTEEQRWQLVSFVRTLAGGAMDDGHMDDGHMDDGHMDDSDGGSDG